MYDEKSRHQKGIRIVKLLEDYLGKEKLKTLNLLDLGSSTGIIDNILAKKFKSVVGIDTDQEAVHYAQKTFKKSNLRFIVDDATNTKIKNNSFDVVVCTHIYEHVTNSRKLFNEIYRVLKPTGVCYLAAINGLWPLEPHHKLLFLSWLPKRIANYYVRIMGKSDKYRMNPLTIHGLKSITHKFNVVDYTPKILRNPGIFGFEDDIQTSLQKLITSCVAPFSNYLAPTFFWVLRKETPHKAVFCISLDTELLWGRRDVGYEKFIKRAGSIRQIIKKLLAIFDKYGIHATWAIVGSLFLPSREYVESDSLWRGADIVKEIRSHKNQEIACHSFTHPEFTKLSLKEAEEEISQCLHLAKKSGVTLQSFVFPRNLIKHLGVLNKYKFCAYRGPEGAKNKILQMLDYLLLIPHSSKITKQGSLLNIPGTMYYLSARGFRKYIPYQIRVNKAINGINHAIKNGSIFHLWFHPIDLADNSKNLLRGIEEIMAYVKKKEKEGVIKSQNMQEISSNHDGL